MSKAIGQMSKVDDQPTYQIWKKLFNLLFLCCLVQQFLSRSQLMHDKEKIIKQLLAVIRSYHDGLDSKAIPR